MDINKVILLIENIKYKLTLGLVFKNDIDYKSFIDKMKKVHRIYNIDKCKEAKNIIIVDGYNTHVSIADKLICKIMQWRIKNSNNIIVIIMNKDAIELSKTKNIFTCATNLTLIIDNNTIYTDDEKEVDINTLNIDFKSKVI